MESHSIEVTIKIFFSMTQLNFFIDYDLIKYGIKKRRHNKIYSCSFLTKDLEMTQSNNNNL